MGMPKKALGLVCQKIKEEYRGQISRQRTDHFFKKSLVTVQLLSAEDTA